MKNKVVALGVLLSLAAGTRPSFGCSDYRPPTAFIARYGPDIPLERFLGGDLGVLQPTWSRAHLVVAYRYLSGVPLSANERDAAQEFFEGRVSIGRSDGSGLEAWEAAHEEITGSRPRVETEAVGDVYGYYVNCGDDAFERASETLTGYVTRFGAVAPETRDWLAAQDAVFSNCSRRKVAIPDGLPPAAPAAMRADRIYQIASAKFYSGMHEEAQKDFERIASDTDSPWHDIAAYLAARALLRQATLEASDSLRPAAFARARAAFVAAGAAAPTPEIKRWCEDLTRYVDLRHDSASRIPAAASRLASPLPGDEFGPALAHYRDLLRRVMSPYQRGKYEPAEEDDLTRWIVAFQEGQVLSDPRRSQAFGSAIASWEKKRTLPWLVAVLSMISPDHPSYPDILNAAREVPPGSPGAFDVTYRIARLDVMAGRFDDARRSIAKSFEQAREEGPSATNIFLDLKVQIAGTFLEFVAAAPRHPVDGDAPRPWFDALGRDVLNEKLSLDSLVRFLDQAELKPESRDLFQRTLLVRAILLGRRNVARKLAGDRAPQVNFDDPEWRVEAALRILLPDHTSNPAFLSDPSYGGFWRFLPNRGRNYALPPFLGEAELARAAREAAVLTREGAAGTWFCREALAFSKRHPGDSRAPEFLSRAVKVARVAQSDDETTEAAQAAFRRLHGRYEDTIWAKETKYWYTGRGY